MTHPKADAGARQCFQERIEAYEQQCRPVVYIDESGFAQDMPRIYGYSPRGQRCPGIRDWQAKGRINVIGALLSGVLLSVGLTEANIDAGIFNLWLEQDLMPKLPPASVIVLDNATFHRREDTKAAIKAAGHTLEYLPAYSPDLNDIEHKWAQAKSYRRKTGKSVEEIFRNQKWNQN